MLVSSASSAPLDQGSPDAGKSGQDYGPKDGHSGFSDKEGQKPTTELNLSLQARALLRFKNQFYQNVQ